MIGIKRSLVALAMGAAFAASGAIGASAAPVSNLGTSLATPAAKIAADNVIEVRRRGGKRFYRGGGRRHGHYRRHHRGGNNFWWAAPLIAAPFLYNGYGYYDDYGYGYGDGNYCYRECRYEHGPRYCRRYWRRYC